MRKILIVFLFLGWIGCSDATRASFNSYGNAAHIRCYSGGVLIYEGDSTGRVATTSESDGWEWKDDKTGKFVRVSGTCIIEN